jgi:hypothetical protein
MVGPAATDASRRNRRPLAVASLLHRNVPAKHSNAKAHPYRLAHPAVGRPRGAFVTACSLFWI